MRPGVAVSVVGHVGAVMMTMLAWQAHTTLAPQVGAVVPVEIVDVAPESNVRALTDVNTPEGEEQQNETVEAEPAPAPAPTPTPPQPQRRQNDTFDLSAVARMVDKQRTPGRERTRGESADRNQQGAGLGTAEVAALEDRVRALNRRALLRCWRMPADLPDPERLVVTVQFELDRNGELRGQPRVTSPTNYTYDPPMRTAVEAALRAIRSCDFTFFPSDPVVGQRYDAWDNLDFTFAVRN
jgi:hypothetical protein